LASIRLTMIGAPYEDPSPPGEAPVRGSDYDQRLKLMRRLGISLPKDEEPFAYFSPIVRHPGTDPPRPRTRSGDGQSGDDIGLTADIDFKEDFRINFLRKLSYANVWVPSSSRSPQHKTVVIFDWDDTLLCTSFIVDRENAFLDEEKISPALLKQLEQVEAQAKGLLEAALGVGQVFIITNARRGWVEFSALRFLPALWPVLEKVTIISARHRYEEAFPGAHHEWKVRAFLEVQKTLNNQIITNLISVGDSTIEMDAVHIMGRAFEQALVKTVKFRDRPSPDELAKQLSLVKDTFEKICMNPRNLKIALVRKKTKSKQEEGGVTDSSSGEAANRLMAGHEEPEIY